MIPQTLADVARMTLAGEPFDFALRNFLDAFYARPDPAMLLPEPPPLRDAVPQLGAIEDAYLAATAEWLAMRHQFPVPGWAVSETRALRRPWFASPLAALRAVLLHESPAPFRARNLFVSENALTRA
ncbi:MAG: hypothetical protein ACK45B_05170 [Limisphaerales bacterium]